ncbi:pyruvate dehydrogenase (acetyl-transferring) E1 component subunit alpha [Alkalihalobacillus sp. AL-G]|uniref:pyruvate dehydrogenase (acetyl-transferring) E1 component subunit alpha n=1 Tax=Alkalihalobacillus sp. AL-G TaxID=2926399 RepID=UPI00272D1DB1|nr:pyruvate dehydrogenase (acetyl-transferring) E1 component subunit alpha [Alkalihalobacillus sp. AL-G]WLD94143.1 pyruvate dehydrogenase (acetyl-transferring) E1 component subunit alpha [Alkalihalobacillus sp. AL-G]
METQFPTKQILNEDGIVVNSEFENEMTESLTKELYTKMLRARMFDRKGVNLQRQGRIGTYVPFEGQEAAQIGSALVLEEGDWMFPTYRDHAATLTYGHSLRNLFLYWKGYPMGCVPPEGKNIFPPAVPIASQLLHATGAAWAEKMKGTDRGSIVYFGDGATSEGDFHEGLNFASVFDVPVVFFNQNNGFAISVPIEKQMKSKTIAQKAVGYDIPGIRLDGNDVFAVYFETRLAMDNARKGNGPTLIEAVTYRYGAHTTADDPSKYRDQSEAKRRREQTDPIVRLERYMQHKGIWEDSWKTKVEEEITAEIEKAVEEMEAFGAADSKDMFTHVFAKPTWTIQEQLDEFNGRAKEEV